MHKVVVILMNLGGPKDLEGVRPFLLSLFQDPFIIRLPQPFRWIVAQLISRLRTRTARGIYQALGGKSPLLANTQAQAHALEHVLNEQSKEQYHVCIAMRHAPPLTNQTVQDVIALKPDRVILLPLYPQYSSTTTLSSLQAWLQEARVQGLSVPTQSICCYPTLEGLVQTYADAVYEAIKSSSPQDQAKVMVLFSAHGLPMRIVRLGDPYPHHVHQTVQAIVAALKKKGLTLTSDQTVLCYQSRVGPMAWLTPSTVTMIQQAGRDQRPVVLVPVSFVSEHSETLYELDQEYQEVARQAGVPSWVRVPTPAVSSQWIQGLAQLVQYRLGCGDEAVCSVGLKCDPYAGMCARKVLA